MADIEGLGSGHPRPLKATTAFRLSFGLRAKIFALGISGVAVLGAIFAIGMQLEARVDQEPHLGEPSRVVVGVDDAVQGRFPLVVETSQVRPAVEKEPHHLGRRVLGCPVQWRRPVR